MNGHQRIIKAKYIFLPYSRRHITGHRRPDNYHYGILTIHYEIRLNDIAQHLDNVLRIILNHLNNALENQGNDLIIHLGISSIYSIRNRVTGQLRRFFGHFGFRNNVIRMLHDFNIFNNSFEQLRNVVNSSLTPHNIENRMLLQFVNSLWTFDNLIKLVISFQIQIQGHELRIVQQCVRHEIIEYIPIE